MAGWVHGQTWTQEILRLETSLAQLQWTRLQNRDRQKIYSNQLSFAAADAVIPGLDLAQWFDGYAAPLPNTLVLGQDGYFLGLGAIVNETPLDVWKA